MKCFIFPQKFCVVYLVIKRRHKTSISFIFKLLKMLLFWQHSNATRIIHSRVLSREHRAELEFRRGIAAINNNYIIINIRIILIHAGSHRMHHTCTCFWRAFNFCVRTQITIRRVTAFNNYKGSLQMWCIDLIQQINKQVLHDFALYHHRK